jgi:hypothetical protein
LSTAYFSGNHHESTSRRLPQIEHVALGCSVGGNSVIVIAV